MQSFLEFEQHLVDLDDKITQLRHISGDGEVNVVDEIVKLQTKYDNSLKQTYEKLTPWNTVQVARHSSRPHFSHYIKLLVKDWIPLCGDRAYGDDDAILGGIGRFRGRSVVFIGQEKGHNTKTRIKHNFGMAKPEGYRKAIRLMEFASHFKLPIVTLIDTSGAYPGVGAEERGQAEAIARSIEKCLSVKTPIISIVIGEGGSGGAIALAATDKVLMLEHAIYSVISPEGCASILWRSADFAKQAAETLRITAKDLYKLGVIDEVIKEPLGGAHRNHNTAANNLADCLEKYLEELSCTSGKELVANRGKKFIKMGRKS